MPTLYQVILIALIAAFSILFIGKTGIRDKIVEKAPKLLSMLFDCDYCLSFWTAMLMCVVMYFTTFDSSYLFVPILSTPITRFLL